MKHICLIAAMIAVAGCGSATEVAPTRYNFGIVDGANQVSTAGTSALQKKITAQLTRDPQGEFAWVDFLLPTKAYAQGLTLPGDPVADAIVCGREAAEGEPQVIPLCAFTLADGKAVNSVKPGTKAGTFTLLFTAQIASQQPVQDSTTVVVEAGPASQILFCSIPGITGLTTGKAPVLHPGDVIDIRNCLVRDQWQNDLPAARSVVDSVARDDYMSASGIAAAIKGSVYVVPPDMVCPIVLNGLGCHVVYFWVGSARSAAQFNVQP